MENNNTLMNKRKYQASDKQFAYAKSYVGVGVLVNHLKDQINGEMDPYKKQNVKLMNIINAAEKGHSLLLNTMQNINTEMSSKL